MQRRDDHEYYYHQQLGLSGNEQELTNSGEFLNGQPEFDYPFYQPEQQQRAPQTGQQIHQQPQNRHILLPDQAFLYHGEPFSPQNSQGLYPSSTQPFSNAPLENFYYAPSYPSVAAAPQTQPNFPTVSSQQSYQQMDQSKSALYPSPLSGSNPSPALGSSSLPSLALAPPPHKIKRQALKPNPSQQVHQGSFNANPVNGNASKAKTKPNGTAVKRGRNIHSCVPCRKRKLKCNRVTPCAACQERGEECIWEDAVPLFTLKSDNDVKDLKEQISRLEQLVENLTAAQNSEAAKSTTTGTASSISTTLLKRVQATEKGKRVVADEEGEVIGMKSHDLCSALSQLVLGGYIDIDNQWGLSAIEATPSHLGNLIIDDARRELDTGLSLAHIGPSVKCLKDSKVGLLRNFFGTYPTVHEVLASLPSREEQDLAYDIFQKRSTLGCGLRTEDFDLKREKLQEILSQDSATWETTVDRPFLAVYLAVLATGTALGLLTKHLSQDHLEDSYEKMSDLATAAVKALAASKFANHPTPETVLAATVLSRTLLLIFGGPESSFYLGILTMAVHNAYLLSMHRDPGRIKDLTFKQMEERRRIFWFMFSQIQHIGEVFAKNFPQIDLKQIDCKFPLNLNDDEIDLDERAAKMAAKKRSKSGELADMTGAIIYFQISKLSNRLSDIIHGLAPVSYGTIQSLDGELQKLEHSIPPVYRLGFDDDENMLDNKELACRFSAIMLEIHLAACYLRLHRPWLGKLPGNQDRYSLSKRSVRRYAKRIVSLVCTSLPVVRPSFVFVYMLGSAITSLLIEQAYSEEELFGLELRSGSIETGINWLERFKDSLEICSRCYHLVSFLRDILEEGSSTSEAKRVKLDNGVSSFVQDQSTAFSFEMLQDLQHASWQDAPDFFNV